MDNAKQVKITTEKDDNNKEEEATCDLSLQETETPAERSEETEQKSCNLPEPEASDEHIEETERKLLEVVKSSCDLILSKIETDVGHTEKKEKKLHNDDKDSKSEPNNDLKSKLSIDKRTCFSKTVPTRYRKYQIINVPPRNTKTPSPKTSSPKTPSPKISSAKTPSPKSAMFATSSPNGSVDENSKDVPTRSLKSWRPLRTTLNEITDRPFPESSLILLPRSSPSFINRIFYEHTRRISVTLHDLPVGNALREDNSCTCTCYVNPIIVLLWICLVTVMIIYMPKRSIY